MTSSPEAIGTPRAGAPPNTTLIDYRWRSRMDSTEQPGQLCLIFEKGKV